MSCVNFVGLRVVTRLACKCQKSIFYPNLNRLDVLAKKLNGLRQLGGFGLTCLAC